MPNRQIQNSMNARRQTGVKRAKGWTDARREQFLSHLAATCNIRASVRFTGLSENAVFALRMRDPEFAEDWQAAIEAGYDRIEAMVMARSLGQHLVRTEADGPVDPAFPDIDHLDTELALQLLRIRRNQRAGLKQHEGRKARPSTKQELVTALLKRIGLMRDYDRRTGGGAEAGADGA